MVVVIKRQVATITMLALCCVATMAQAPAQPPRKSAPASRVSQRGDKQNTPQVVTIVHRLNGLKLFRVLLRSEQQAMALAGLDSDFKLLEDVHTNVIAGVAMDDGQTIAAWLPEADIELGPSDYQGSTPEVPAVPAVPGVPSVPSGTPVSPWDGVRGSFFAPPDVTVIGADGKQVVAKYVGFDAVTGLSILKLTDNSLPAAGTIKDEKVADGESVRLLGPEPVSGQRGLLNSSLYVRIGATEGRVFDVRRAPTGGIARFKVMSPRLSQAIIGGVAVNAAGETVGIVTGLEGGEASILPAEIIRRAVERVVARQASVPKPYLGVRGEAVAELKVGQMLNHGWQPERAATLTYDHRGILVTSVVPGSPADQAALQAGDVILKVNEWAIQNGDDFTWFLDQAGPSSMVSFTVARPDSLVNKAFEVKLSATLDQGREFKRRVARRARGDSSDDSERFVSLTDQGIETITLRAPVASQLGTTAGLLVVYVEPATAAFKAGLQPGDVIKSINGQALATFQRAFTSQLNQPTTFTFEVVRNKQRRTVTVTNPAKKKQ